MNNRRVILIVMDSVGIGEMPDADEYGDVGASTLGHIAERVPTLSLPNLCRLGLASIEGANINYRNMNGSDIHVCGAYGRAAELSAAPSL